MEAALRRGANAVLALRFDTASVGELTEVNAYGTAVVLIATKDAKKGGKGSNGNGDDNTGGGKKGNEVRRVPRHFMKDRSACPV